MKHAHNEMIKNTCKKRKIETDTNPEESTEEREEVAPKRKKQKTKHVKTVEKEEVVLTTTHPIGKGSEACSIIFKLYKNKKDPPTAQKNSIDLDSFCKQTTSTNPEEKQKRTLFVASSKVEVEKILSEHPYLLLFRYEYPKPNAKDGVGHKYILCDHWTFVSQVYGIERSNGETDADRAIELFKKRAFNVNSMFHHEHMMPNLWIAAALDFEVKDNINKIGFTKFAAFVKFVIQQVSSLMSIEFKLLNKPIELSEWLTTDASDYKTILSLHAIYRSRNVYFDCRDSLTTFMYYAFYMISSLCSQEGSGIIFSDETVSLTGDQMYELLKQKIWDLGIYHEMSSLRVYYSRKFKEQAEARRLTVVDLAESNKSAVREELMRFKTEASKRSPQEKKTGYNPQTLLNSLFHYVPPNSICTVVSLNGDECFNYLKNFYDTMVKKKDTTRTSKKRSTDANGNYIQDSLTLFIPLKNRIKKNVFYYKSKLKNIPVKNETQYNEKANELYIGLDDAKYMLDILEQWRAAKTTDRATNKPMSNIHRSTLASVFKPDSAELWFAYGKPVLEIKGKGYCSVVHGYHKTNRQSFSFNPRLMHFCQRCYDDDCKITPDKTNYPLSQQQAERIMSILMHVPKIKSMFFEAVSSADAATFVSE